MGRPELDQADLSVSKPPACPVVLAPLPADAQTEAFHLGSLLCTISFLSPSFDLKVPGTLSPLLASSPSQGSSQSSEGGRKGRRNWKKAADSLCFTSRSMLPCLSLALVLFALAMQIGAETATTSPGRGASPKC